MTKRFVEVIDPYEKHTRRRKARKSKPNRNLNANPVVIGDGPNCDYSQDEWDSLMEYYYAYEYTSKSN